ncbi:MAG: hypothetical protein M3Y07_10465 [Acidobacteriota bacterium]|nr:hypothetical protein [Acidobacteriota bacterium]
MRFSLAGLQAGMLASLTMLVWLAATSIWYKRSVWSVPNLLSSTFFGEAAFRAGFGKTTYSGIALHLFLYSVLGVLFGLIVRGSRSRMAVLIFGLMFGVLCYYVLFGVVWKAVNPLVALYVPNRPMLAGHFLYGAMLGRFPSYRDAIAPVTVGLTR